MLKQKKTAKLPFRDVRAKELYRGRIHRWRVSLVAGMPAELLGYIDAANEVSAIEAAAKEYNISTSNQLVVQREG